jgi:tetratricopeptide (TPR) repeat protein
MNAQLSRGTEGPSALREVGQAHAWLSDALAASGRLAEALVERQSELAAYTAVLAEDGRNHEVRTMAGRAQHAICEIHLLEGDIAAAIPRCLEAVSAFGPLIEQDPENGLVRELATGAANSLAEALLLDGRLDEADAALAQATAMGAALMQTDPARTSWRHLLMRARWLEIASAFARGRADDARDGLARLEAEFGPFRDRDIATGSAGAWSMILAIKATERLAAGDLAAAETHAMAARQAIGATPDATESAVIAFLARQIPQAGMPPVEPTSAYPAAALLGPILKSPAPVR